MYTSLAIKDCLWERCSREDFTPDVGSVVWCTLSGLKIRAARPLWHIRKPLQKRGMTRNDFCKFLAFLAGESRAAYRTAPLISQIAVGKNGPKSENDKVAQVFCAISWRFWLVAAEPQCAGM
jgi:hypothetical protein